MRTLALRPVCRPLINFSKKILINFFTSHHLPKNTNKNSITYSTEKLLHGKAGYLEETDKFVVCEKYNYLCCCLVNAISGQQLTVTWRCRRSQETSVTPACVRVPVVQNATCKTKKSVTSLMNIQRLQLRVLRHRYFFNCLTFSIRYLKM